jgi:hypothetical protein
MLVTATDPVGSIWLLAYLIVRYSSLLGDRDVQICLVHGLASAGFLESRFGATQEMTQKCTILSESTEQT